MKKIISGLILYLFIFSTVYAESQLPKCKGNDLSKYHYCYSAYIFPETYKFKFSEDKNYFKGNLKNIYEGEWLVGLPYGKGKFMYANGYIYEGTFVSGKKDGDGKITFGNKGSYKGRWRDDLPDGLGTYILNENGTKKTLEAFFERSKISSLCYSSDKVMQSPCKLTTENYQSGKKTTIILSEIKNDSESKKLLNKIIGR